MTKRTVGMYGGKFLPLHAGHVYMITTAACMVDELYVVLSYSEIRDQKLVEEGNIKPLPYQLRLRWLSQITKDMGNVKVIAVEDTAEDDDTYDWVQGADDIKAAIGKPIDVVFGSEISYKPIFNALYPRATYQIIDPNREMFPISATKIRTEGAFNNWEFIPDVAKPYFVKTVMIVGTESCGKSTLTRYLAKTFNTNYVEEYGRTIAEELGRCEDVMTKEDFFHIAYGHKLKEKEAKQNANKVLFIDTEALITQYYAKLYLGETYPLLEEIIHQEDYDLWLFLEPDVKWVDDGTRDFGEEFVRRENNRLLKQMLKERNISYEIINGDYQQRFTQAFKKTKELLSTSKELAHAL